jgi:hypothetical protein
MRKGSHETKTRREAGGPRSPTAPNTVTRIENGSDAKQSTVAALRAALESAGVEFIAENGGGAGVRLRKNPLG